MTEQQTFALLLGEAAMAVWGDMPRDIQEALFETAMRDREDLRNVPTPTLVIAREGDDIHPAEVARVICGTMPNFSITFRMARMKNIC